MNRNRFPVTPEYPEAQTYVQFRNMLVNLEESDPDKRLSKLAWKLWGWMDEKLAVKSMTPKELVSEGETRECGGEMILKEIYFDCFDGQATVYALSDEGWAIAVFDEQLILTRPEEPPKE